MLYFDYNANSTLISKVREKHTQAGGERVMDLKTSQMTGYFVCIIIAVTAGTLLQLGDYFLLRKLRGGSDETFVRRMAKKLTTITKCVRMLLLPLPFAIAVGAFWQLVLYKHELHLNEKFEGIATTGMIAILGILYSLIVATILGVLWAEYKEMRMAVKRYDVHRFMELKDEEMSPLVHTLLFVLSVFLLGAFLTLKYPDEISGTWCCASVAYLLSMIFFIVLEIDDPCKGIWVIKSIPVEWRTINPKKHRELRNKDTQEKFAKELAAWSQDMFDQAGGEFSWMSVVIEKAGSPRQLLKLRFGAKKDPAPTEE